MWVECCVYSSLEAEWACIGTARLMQQEVVPGRLCCRFRKYLVAAVGAVLPVVKPRQQAMRILDRVDRSIF